MNAILVIFTCVEMCSDCECVIVCLSAGSVGKDSKDSTDCDHDVESLKVLEKQEVKHCLGEGQFMFGRSCVGCHKMTADLCTKSDSNFTMCHCNARILLCNSGKTDGCRHFLCNLCHVEQLAE